MEGGPGLNAGLHMAGSEMFGTCTWSDGHLEKTTIRQLSYE